MKNLLFNAEDFRIDQNVPTSVGERKNLTGFDGEEADCWQIANWNWDWSTLIGEFTLDKNEDYIFCFWLNGGENDRYDEVCDIEIWLDEDYENRTTYKLNRNNFMPALVKNGWYLFCVPFKTAENEKTTIRFNAMGAYTTITASKNPIEYENVESDEVDAKAVQRANVVFENGFPPQEKKWEFKVLGKKITTTPKKVKNIAKKVGIALAVILVVRKIFKKKEK